MIKYYLAIDIGATSGRHIVGWREEGCEGFAPSQIKTKEVYRFPNGNKMENGHLIWDIESLTESVIEGTKKALEQFPNIESLAIDTWGVDYVLIDKDGKPVLPCYAYRDSRTEKPIEEVHSIVPFEKLYANTGIQFQTFNTIYQLYDDKKNGRLEGVTDFLMIPEYLSYVLTGVKKKEYTNATTTGLINAKTGEFDTEIINTLGYPEHLFPKLCQPGETVGMLSDDIAKRVGGQIKVVLCASHDTGSAVEGIGIEGCDDMYISSGTWSLLGVKSPVAITDDNSRIANYSNEGGVGYIRYQKNIMGMWTVNNLQKELCPDKKIQLVEDESRQSTLPPEAYVDINHDDFLAPESMAAAFKKHLKGYELKTEQDYFRCSFNSLAASYDKAIRELEANLGRKFDNLYIVGGGARNIFLNELTEAACGKKVIALPIEATSIGNLAIQIKANENL